VSWFVVPFRIDSSAGNVRAGFDDLRDLNRGIGAAFGSTLNDTNWLTVDTVSACS
jgi:hypothetical protein